MRRLAIFLLVAGCSGTSGGVCEPASETGITPPVTGGTPTTTIYLNRDGGRIAAGSESAGKDTSSIVANHGKTELVVPPAAFDDASWNAVVACVRQAYARFDVDIVDRRPATGGYIMTMFGGTGAGLDLGPDTHGIAPLDSASCSTIEDPIVFVFTDTVGSDIERTCEVAAHEIAHTFGIDHQLLAPDLTSYLPFSGRRSFQDVDAPCGETTERACICGRDTQNTVQILLDKLGPSRAGDLAPPTLHAELGESRDANKVVVRATDASGIGSVTLAYRDDATSFTATCGDGTVPCHSFNGTYTFTIAAPVGHVVFHAEAVDLAGNASATIPIELGTTTMATPTITVAREVGFARIEVVTDALEVSAFWTDANGVTVRHALCETGEDRWTLDIELAGTPGNRAIVIQTTEVSGRTKLVTTQLAVD